MGKTGKLVMLLVAGALGASVPVGIYLRYLQPSVPGVPGEATQQSAAPVVQAPPPQEVSLSNLALGANPPLLVLTSVKSSPAGLEVGGPVQVRFGVAEGNHELTGPDLERFWGALPQGAEGLAFPTAELKLGSWPALGEVPLDLRRDGPATVLKLALPGKTFGGQATLQVSWLPGAGAAELVASAQGVPVPGIEGAVLGFGEARLQGRTLGFKDLEFRDAQGAVLLSAREGQAEAPRRFLRELLVGEKELSRPIAAVENLELVDVRLAGAVDLLGLREAIFRQAQVKVDVVEAGRLLMHGDAVTLEAAKLHLGPVVLGAQALSSGAGDGVLKLKAPRLALPLGLELGAPEGHLEFSVDGRPSLTLEGGTLSPGGGAAGFLGFAARMAALKGSAGRLADQFDGSAFPSFEVLSKALNVEELGALVDALDLACKGCNLEAGVALRGVDFSFGHDRFGNRTLGAARGGDTNEPVALQAVFTPDGAFREAELHVSGARFSAWVGRHLPGQIMKEGALDLRLHFAPKGGLLRFDGEVAATDLVLEHPRVAAWPIHLDPLKAQFGGELDPHARTVMVDLPRLELGEVYWSVNLKLGGLGGVPSVDFALVYPKQDCGKMLKAVPRELVPRLTFASLRGPLEYRLRFAVDMKDVRGTLRFDIKGDWDKCELNTLGPELDVEALNEPTYVHRVVVEGEDLGIDVGPGTDSYVPLYAIPLHVQAAAWGTEDLAFFKHQGFKLGLMRRALILFLERGRFVYGGSTVSQQLVKNLFMYREKSLSRKFEEAVITWAMERKVPKDRILELYLNCIEFGPKIWGIKQAAKVYFDKLPDQLSPLEAAFIMGLKPDPVYGFLQYRRGRVNEQWKGNLKRVMDRLHFQMGVITAEQYAAESDLQPKFAAYGRFKEQEGGQE
jgi:hypothetical protein